jgi:hypothetical protein
MTYTLHAKIDHGRLVVEEPLPAELGEGPVRIVLSSELEQRPAAEVLAQSQSAFAQDILLNADEEVWSND